MTKKKKYKYKLMRVRKETHDRLVAWCKGHLVYRETLSDAIDKLLKTDRGEDRG